MFIDASALTAMMTDENDAAELLARMQRYVTRITSPLAAWEATIAIARILALPHEEAKQAVVEYLALMEIEMIAVPPDAFGIELDAFRAYGKGNHPARLNFADCFSYACARHHGVPLMFKGADFTKTDIEAA